MLGRRRVVTATLVITWSLVPAVRAVRLLSTVRIVGVAAPLPGLRVPGLRLPGLRVPGLRLAGLQLPGLLRSAYVLPRLALLLALLRVPRSGLAVLALSPGLAA